MVRRAFAIGIVTLMASMGASAPTIAAAEPLTLDEAVTIAVAQNPALKVRQALSSAAAETPSQAGALPDPMVTFGVMNLSTDTFDIADENMSQLQIGVSQKLPFPGKRAAMEEAAIHTAQTVLQRQQDFENNLIHRVKQGWWSLYFFDRAIEVVVNNQNLLRQLVQIAESKYTLGKGLQQDVLLAQLELSKLLDKEIILISQREQSAASLNALLGRPVSAPLSLPTMVPKTLPPIQTDAALMALATDSAPTLAAKKEEIKTAEAQLDDAKLAYYPDFTISGTYGYREDNPATGMTRADLVSGMIGLSLALWAPVKQSRKVAEKTFAHQGTLQAYEDAINNVAATIASLTATYRQSKAQANLYATGIIPQATQTVESMRIGYQVNKVDFLNLARAQVTLFNYEVDYWRAVATANQTAAALVAIIGKENIYE